MKWLTHIVALSILCLVATGCLSPVKNQIPLASNADWAKPTSANDTKLTIFNTSGGLAYGIDRTGHINVWLNGQGVGKVKMHRYVQLIVPKGLYDVELVHLDMAKFTSHHQINLTEPESYLQIFATPTSNEAFLVSRPPPDFAEKFKPMRQP